MIFAQNAAAIALRDSYPISAGHSLVIPRQHVSSIYDLADAEQTQLWLLVREVRSIIIEQLSPAGFNIGINDGEAAGQTIPHAHLHVIPRYECEQRPESGSSANLVKRGA